MQHGVPPTGWPSGLYPPNTMVPPSMMSSSLVPPTGQVGSKF